MVSKSLASKMLFGLVVAALLASCTAAPTALPTVPPTVDLKPTFDAVAAQAVQTVVAEMTLNAPPTATATPDIPTDTPAPTNTPAPTETPAPTSTPTREFIPWTATPTATQAPYACSVTDVSPKSGDSIKVDQDFDGKWSVKNTGTETWDAGNTDIRFIEGTKFQQDGDLLDLTENVAPNGTYTVTIDMRAPSSDGTYKTSWGIYLEDGTVCTLNMTINVKD